ncbi:hypothetical protein [Streptomyces blastmyceticus]|uniref:Putative ubiquitin thioesterase L96 n=1 Tax=Streptomyces blastmyceticus TaxID=68180 RepID=A0A077K9I9_9ACTN|nr:putative ubiquitin thioesterase L96 [Streptomyces blastmyceticus]
MSTTEVGAWRGSAEKREQHLELTAEQNRMVTARWETAKEARGSLDGLMRGIEERSARHGGNLEGLDYSLKGLDSFRRKAAVSMKRPGVDAESVCEEVDDLNRYTLTFETDNYVQGTKQTYAELRDRGFEPVSEQNTWEDPVYKGINTAWEHPGTKEKFELQFHTPESFEAKSKNHELYELARSGEFEKYNTEEDPTAAVSYQEASDLLQNERYENVRTPPGVEEVSKRKVRATLNPEVDPEIIDHVRQMETDLKAVHAAGAAAKEQQQTSALGSGLGETLQADGPGLRDRLATKTEPARSPAAQAPAADPLPTQSRGRGRSMA